MHLIATEANEVSEKNNKMTITGDHIVTTLENLGFPQYVDAIKKEMADFNTHTQVSLSLPRSS